MSYRGLSGHELLCCSTYLTEFSFKFLTINHGEKKREREREREVIGDQEVKKEEKERGRENTE